MIFFNFVSFIQIIENILSMAAHKFRIKRVFIKFAIYLLEGIFRIQTKTKKYVVKFDKSLRCSQLRPQYPTQHEHTHESPLLVHCPAFKHGMDAHGSTNICQELKKKIQFTIIYKTYTYYNICRHFVAINRIFLYFIQLLE